jgi:hypothetical protein
MTTEGAGAGKSEFLGRAFLQKHPPQAPLQKLLSGWRNHQPSVGAHGCLWTGMPISAFGEGLPVIIGSDRCPCRSIVIAGP